ncbi:MULTISPECIES: (2Fe-2S)-binding protein [unclassified Streptomyces]|uniref:(2Fe-2S)-binding protein n=1 Tax=unclassified Streptomyces TaxID=2593676 RepID=UPI001BEB11A0|nr:MULTISPECIES: (2Fe-2S)-binding protein [unclassified Streptomyces]MBT2407238.1 (2Fe-2S)-binding protein [Streptomyces sp. ISL-21]MBT2455654.1 (2Fe-2S)-binding protein [Streptomyces sp. ISL-86]MBT2612127.1 (2Fe-2S)-binding protein [Streptomyces sp. ISL-87]
MDLTLNVNGRPEKFAVQPNELLVERLRDGLGLTGTKVGCDTGQCGSCVVQLDGRSAKSCLVLTVSAAGSEVTTIEGVTTPGGELTGLQEALRQEHGTQCGFCTPGMVMALGELVDSTAGGEAPTEPEIREWLTGNLCRCTGYHSVVRGVQRACSAARAEAAGAAETGSAEAGAVSAASGQEV